MPFFIFLGTMMRYHNEPQTNALFYVIMINLLWWQDSIHKWTTLGPNDDTSRLFFCLFLFFFPFYSTNYNGAFLGCKPATTTRCDHCQTWTNHIGPNDVVARPPPRWLFFIIFLLFPTNYMFAFIFLSCKWQRDATAASRKLEQWTSGLFT